MTTRNETTHNFVLTSQPPYLHLVIEATTAGGSRYHFLKFSYETKGPSLAEDDPDYNPEDGDNYVTASKSFFCVYNPAELVALLFNGELARAAKRFGWDTTTIEGFRKNKSAFVDFFLGENSNYLVEKLSVVKQKFQEFDKLIQRVEEIYDEIVVLYAEDDSKAWQEALTKLINLFKNQKG